MADVHIRSVGTALPGPPIDNAALARRLRMSGQWEQWVDVFIGTETRHLSVDLDTGEPRSSLADLAVTASRTALDRAGLGAGDIDLIVMGSALPDLLMPTTVNVVADRLGINQLPTYQLQSGCTGAVQALHLGVQLLGTGQYRNALVIGGDTTAKILDFDADFTRLSPDQMVNYVLFGDGAGAMVLSTEPGPGSAVVRHVLTRLTGQGRTPGQTVDWFGPADRTSSRPPLIEDYKAIEESVPALSVEILAELRAELGWENSDIDFLLPPQLSGRMTERIVKLLDVDSARQISCVQATGNNGNATPFFQVERALAEMTAGQRALCICVESSKWIKAGFAVERV
ncbi:MULTISPECIES: 3-oxoacyl-ACP synthase III family protein [unclassified Streptomyces]|uniref:3-oxoacyl-ACP synthase III family protein n=1 Tax=unclassified Streptomyces TaxID=2593676 RepID=UPI002E2C01DA|nr:3-oxoacyl-ACP synthase III family protein [Streptomyces sp. NBC_00223]